MNEKVFYCELCNDLVPENDVEDLFKIGQVIHTYIINDFNSHNSSRIAEKRIICGIVREPTAEEYFIHYTCNPNPLKRKPRKNSEVL